jgi:acetyl-CoA C-acetyltransferase
MNDTREPVAILSACRTPIGRFLGSLAETPATEPGRQVGIGVGVPPEAPAYTVNQACASGLKAIALAATAVADGERLVLAGGMENMTRVPFYLERARTGYRMGNAPIVDGMYRDGFHCPLADQLMGATAETLADQGKITRGEQDEFSI